MLVALPIVLVACPQVRHESRLFYWNGQLAVLAGENDSSGAREGLWVYYSEDGQVEYSKTWGNGVTIDATGIYAAGKRVRMPTADELDTATEQAREIMRSHRR